MRGIALCAQRWSSPLLVVVSCTVCVIQLLFFPAEESGRSACRRRWAPTTSCCTRPLTECSTCPCSSAGTSSGSAQVCGELKALLPACALPCSPSPNLPAHSQKHFSDSIFFSSFQKWSMPRWQLELCLRSKPRELWESASRFLGPPFSSSPPTSHVRHLQSCSQCPGWGRRGGSCTEVKKQDRLKPKLRIAELRRIREEDCLVTNLQKNCVYGNRNELCTIVSLFPHFLSLLFRLSHFTCGKCVVPFRSSWYNQKWSLNENYSFLAVMGFLSCSWGQ